jgi:hypothetical protein
MPINEVPPMPSRLKNTFIAKDIHGIEFTVEVWVDTVSARKPTVSFGTHAEVEGLKSLRTSDGLDVNYVTKGKYQVLTTAGYVDLTSDDPNAL